MGRIHAEVCISQQCGHRARFQPPAVDGDARHLPLLLGSKRRRYADEDFRTRCGKLFGKYTSLGGSAEYHSPHTRYPRGVTIFPRSSRVAAFPM